MIYICSFIIVCLTSSAYVILLIPSYLCYVFKYSCSWPDNNWPFYISWIDVQPDLKKGPLLLKIQLLYTKPYILVGV